MTNWSNRLTIHNTGNTFWLLPQVHWRAQRCVECQISYTRHLTENTIQWHVSCRKHVCELKTTTVGLKMVMCFVWGKRHSVTFVVWLIFIAWHVTQDNKFWVVISSGGNVFFFFINHQNGMIFCTVTEKQSRINLCWLLNNLKIQIQVQRHLFMETSLCCP